MSPGLAFSTALPKLLSIEEACARAAAYASPLEDAEDAPITAAIGRALAGDVRAVRPCPPFDQSAMDGFAIMAGGGLPVGARLKVEGRIAAGHFGCALGIDRAARIFTGAPMPAGADAVVMQEHVDSEGDSVVLRHRVESGEHIRRRGEDVSPGDLLARAGQRLDPRLAALLAAQGFRQVRVRRRLRVALISTGDELREPGVDVADGPFVYDSNRPMLVGLATSAAFEVTDAGRVPDDPEKLADVLCSVAGGCDLIVTSGGVSVGEEDHSATALSRAGGSCETLRIALKPGKPAVVGRLGTAAYLGLPGNPVSALVSWSLIGRAVVSGLEGRPFKRPAGLPLVLSHGLTRRPGRTEFLPARLVTGLNGPEIEVLASNSARLRPLAEADGFMEVPEGMASAEPGSRFPFHPLERFTAM